MFLLDTNVISELRKPEGRVSPEVVQWVSTQNATSLYVSMVTLYELEAGSLVWTRDERLMAAARELDVLFAE